VVGGWGGVGKKVWGEVWGMWGSRGVFLLSRVCGGHARAKSLERMQFCFLGGAGTSSYFQRLQLREKEG